jgi:5-methylcytosine-specific restriction protein B
MAKGEYPLSQCARDLHMEESALEHWVQAIERKKQAVLYGPPGTGKTYVAEHLARHLSSGNDGFVDVIQFHPSYSYEDFIQAKRFRPVPDGGVEVSLESGRFLQFCDRARVLDGRCVLVIDEINRADLPRVFGELLYLLEYRDRQMLLAGGRSFSIPANVRILGTMNTADRSVALADYALRRRFAFLPLYPDYEMLRRYHHDRHTDFDVELLVGVLARVNREIREPDFAVGPSFFMREDVGHQIEGIWRTEIEPYLEEYFHGQRDRAERFRWDRVGRDIVPPA